MPRPSTCTLFGSPRGALEGFSTKDRQVIYVHESERLYGFGHNGWKRAKSGDWEGRGPAGTVV